MLVKHCVFGAAYLIEYMSVCKTTCTPLLCFSLKNGRGAIKAGKFEIFKRNVFFLLEWPNTRFNVKPKHAVGFPMKNRARGSKAVQVVLQTDIYSMRYAAPNTQVFN